MKKDKYNASGCKDLTAYKAMKNIEREEERFNKLLQTIFNICDLAGFHLDGRIAVTDKKTGRVWR